MSDLMAWLKACVDADEAAARESFHEGQRWITEEEGVYRWPDDELVHMADRKADARHVARHDPARVLREVAHKRRVLDRHQGYHSPAMCSWCSDSEKYAPWPCPDIADMVAIYGDQPGYEQFASLLAEAS
jgi:uncharacterized protein DUF6221